MTAQLSHPTVIEESPLPDDERSRPRLPGERQRWSDRSVQEGTQLLANYDHFVEGVDTSTLFTHIPAWFAQLLAIGRASRAAAATESPGWPIKDPDAEAAVS